MATVTCTLTGGARFETQIRTHTLIIDGPASIGGIDDGPSPPEIMVASLGSCVGMYALMFCAKHGITPDGMIVTTDWTKVDNPTRIGSMKVKVTLPAGIPAEKLPAFMRTVEECMVHNTLSHHPEVCIELVAHEGGEVCVRV